HLPSHVLWQVGQFFRMRRSGINLSHFVSICRNFRANRIDVLSLCELLRSSCFAFTLDHTSPPLNRPERCRTSAQYLFTLISLLSTWTDRPRQRTTRLR